MPFFEWTDQFSVGVDTFDTQHKKLAGYLNDLHDAMLDGRGNHALASILNGLIEYTKTHFEDEENAMQQYGYEQLEDHRDEHAELTDQVLRFQRQFLAGEAILSVPIMQFLKEWLSHHILETDKQYEGFMREHGVM